MTYTRDDIYICPSCGYFFDEKTDKPVDVSYSEMPADFALEVMQVRQSKSKCNHKPKRHKVKVRGKGFSIG